MRILLAWLLAVLALAGSPVLAAIPPRPEGPVLDQAAIIPDAQEAALDQKLRAYNAATGRAIVVVTIASLDGADVFDYTQELADSWGVGGKETDEGVIFLIAPQERKLRIHTGLGVQDRLTDALSGRIIRDTVTPRFKAGDFPGGIEAGVDAIVTQLDRSPADARAVAEAAAAARSAAGDDGVSIGSVIFWLVLIVFFIAIFARKGAQRGRRSGIDPGVVLWGLSEIAHHMADNRSRGGGGFDFGGGGVGGSGGGGFGGFGGGGFDGGGASGDW